MSNGRGWWTWSFVPILVPQLVVEADYGLKTEPLKIKARAALAGYVLRHWSVDSAQTTGLTPRPIIFGYEMQRFYGVESAASFRGAKPWHR
jgi:hypothetical protein